jgi:hypothetical protein
MIWEPVIGMLVRARITGLKPILPFSCASMQIAAVL